MKKAILNLGSKVLYNGCKGKVIAVVKTPNHQKVLFYTIEVATGKGFKSVNVLPTEFTVIERGL